MIEQRATVKYELRFSGHESFPMRYGWLPKGVQGVIDDSSIFVRSNATVSLGVGKNMVAAIRHWCLATEMIQPLDRVGNMEPTALGKRIFGEGGWDPYFEDIGTTWLVHWVLVRRAQRASTWPIAFTKKNGSQFQK